MNKQELIKYETEKFHKQIERINALPDIPQELGYAAYCALGDEMYNKKITIEQLALELHKLREALGEYKIGQYWVPYPEMVCVDYTFGKTTVRYRIETKDEQGVISILSGGKCKIVDRVSKSVVCEL
jgi:hypothetical protein